MSKLPRLYRRLIADGMTTWGPWYLIDDAESILAPVDMQKNGSLQRQFRMEANAGFEVYLFARRQDQDDFAFFHVDKNGVVQDSVHLSHLAFSSGPDELTPKHVVEHKHQSDLKGWLRDVAIPDMMDWFQYDGEDAD